MKTDEGRLRDILDAIEKIEKYANRGRTAFENDELIQVWCVHHLQIIGEAAHKISAETREIHAETPWTKIIGMRHVLVHDYFGIDLDIVWEVVDRNLPDLECNVRAILRGMSDQPSTV